MIIVIHEWMARPDAFYPLNQINICQIRQFQNLVDAMMAVTSTKTFLTVEFIFQVFGKNLVKRAGTYLKIICIHNFSFYYIIDFKI